MQLSENMAGPRNRAVFTQTGSNRGRGKRKGGRKERREGRREEEGREERWEEGSQTRPLVGPEEG